MTQLVPRPRARVVVDGATATCAMTLMEFYAYQWACAARVKGSA